MTLYIEILIALMIIVIVVCFAYLTGYRRALIEVSKLKVIKKQKEIE